MPGIYQVILLRICGVASQIQDYFMRSFIAMLLCSMMVLVPGLSRAGDWEDCVSTNLDIAIRGCTALIAEGQAIKKSLNNRGYAYKQQGELDLAIADFNKAIELDPNYRNAYENRGSAYTAKGELDLAIADYQRAIQIAPDKPFAYFMRGFVYSKKRDLDAEIADYDRAIKIDPNYSYAYSSRSIALSEKGRNAEALADIRKFVELRPDDVKGKARLEKLEKIVGLENPGKNAAATAPAVNGPANANLKDCLSADASIAIRGCSAMIDKGEASKKTYYFRSFAYSSKGDFVRALADIGEAMKLDPNYAGAYSSRGDTYQKMGKHELAIADYSKAIALEPDDVYPYSRRGNAYLAVNKVDLAIADYNRAISIDPGYASAYFNRSFAFGDKGMKSEALADMRKFVALKPDAPSGLKYLKKLEEGAAPAKQHDVLVNAPPAQKAAPALPQIAATAGKRLALVIGNSKYAHANPLVNPANDATAMTAMLGGMGFEVLSGVDLDLDGMNALLRDFSRKALDSDIALLFYAGHGMQVGTRNYLVPVDAKLEDPTAVDFELVEINQSVIKYMGGGDRIGIVILDACRDNPLSRSLARSFGTTRSGELKQGLAEMRTAGGVLVAFATAPGDVAADGDGRNSPFTQALLKYLPTPGMEFERVLKRVKSDVYQTTRQKQEPWSNSSLREDLFLVAQ